MSMQTEKILFTDLDGTLLDEKKQISIKNRVAIELALSSGHKIVIATGRPLSSAKILARELSLNRQGCYIIASNGAVLYDCYQKKILFQKGVPLKYVRPLFNRAYRENLHVHTYSETNILSERDTKEIRWYEKTIRVPALIVEDVTKALTFDPVKVLLIHLESKQRLIDFQRKHSGWCKGKFESIFSCDSMLEYCPVSTSKGDAVIRLCNLLQIPIENSISAGDAENDISMIQAAGTGCVMCNGSKETKDYADYITRQDNNHDGVAEIIEEFMF